MRPDWAGDKDFGIVVRTDYGCLTLLATDSAPGLEVQMRDGTWAGVHLPVGEFVINFGEMLEMWTAGRAPRRTGYGGRKPNASPPCFSSIQTLRRTSPPSGQAG